MEETKWLKPSGSLVERTVERFGRLDVAVNSAGMEGI